MTITVAMDGFDSNPYLGAKRPGPNFLKLVSDPGELVFDREVCLFAGKAREGSLPRQVTDQATKSAGEASAPATKKTSEENQGP